MSKALLAAESCTSLCSKSHTAIAAINNEILKTWQKIFLYSFVFLKRGSTARNCAALPRGTVHKRGDVVSFSNVVCVLNHMPKANSDSMKSSLGYLDMTKVLGNG